MQPTKSYNNRINAKISGSEIADHRRDDYNSYDDNSGGRATVFNLNNKNLTVQDRQNIYQTIMTYGIIQLHLVHLQRKLGKVYY